MKERLSFHGIKNVLSRSEMRSIMAGSGTSGCGDKISCSGGCQAQSGPCSGHFGTCVTSQGTCKCAVIC